MVDLPSDGKGSEVDYESLATAVADVNVVATPDGVFRYVSPRCRHVFGWDPIYLEGRSEDSFVHPDDLETVRAGRRNLREAKSLP